VAEISIVISTELSLFCVVIGVIDEKLAKVQDAEPIPLDLYAAPLCFISIVNPRKD